MDDESNDVMLEDSRSISDGTCCIDLEKGGKSVNSNDNATKIITSTSNEDNDDAIKRGISKLSN